MDQEKHQITIIVPKDPAGFGVQAVISSNGKSTVETTIVVCSRAIVSIPDRWLEARHDLNDHMSEAQRMQDIFHATG